MTVEPDEHTIKRVMRHIVFPLLLGLAIGFGGSQLVAWQVFVPVVLVVSFGFCIHSLRWVRRQQREMEAAHARVQAFLAHYDRHKPS